jgi:hypothetical protein
MSEDWRYDLRKKYPFLKCAIDCDIGWYKLLDNLFKEIDDWYTQYHWDQLPEFMVTDIKEKYGTLRVYVGSSHETIFDMIDRAEEESAHTCEECGEEGSIRTLAGWYRTVCDKCYTSWMFRRL